MAKRNWAWARQRWESTNLTLADVARELGVTRAAVCTRAKKEGWARIMVSEADVHHRADRLPEEAAEPPHQVLISHPIGGMPEQEAIDMRARLIQAHRREWREHAREFSVQKMANAGLAFARRAKMSADAILARQRGERLAWGLDEPQMRPQEIVIEWLEEPRPEYDCAQHLSTPRNESFSIARPDSGS